MRKRKKIIVIVIVIVIVSSLVGWQIYEAVKLRHSDAWKDANPTKEQVDKWLMKNFDPAGYEIWNKNPTLEGPEFGFGSGPDGQKFYNTIWDQEYYITPFGEDDWGMSCFTWGYLKDKKETKTYPIKMCYLLNHAEEKEIFVFISHYNYKECNDDCRKYGQYGVGAILQGWAHSKPPPFNHRIPPPLETANKKIVLSFDMKIDIARIDANEPDVWQFVGVNLWLKSPESEKRIVMDLMVYASGDSLFTEITDTTYRYQKNLEGNRAPMLKKWQHYDIDVSWFIADMLKRFEIKHAAPSLKLYSLEILCETVFGECGFWTKNVYLYYR